MGYVLWSQNNAVKYKIIAYLGLILTIVHSIDSVNVIAKLSQTDKTSLVNT